MPLKSACICVFAKPPRAGLVKTRLADAMGPEAAAALARAFFEDTWSVVSRVEWAEPVLATTDVDAPEWDELTGFTIWPQGRGDLGQRMEEVMRRALSTHRVALAVGTDSPGLPAALLDAAREALRTADAVLGPCDDGGFYLLGLRSCPVGLLSGIPWSTDTTFAHTVRAFRLRGLRTAVLPPWFDVDRPADVDRLRQMLAHDRVSAPATARALLLVPAGR
jgi:hypothetical protein